jgi:hypothetical protein
VSAVGWAAGVWAVLWLAGAPVPGRSAPSPAAVPAAPAALVEVYLNDAPDTTPGGGLLLCSGVPLAGTDLVATAGHCAANLVPGAEHVVHWAGQLWPVTGAAAHPDYEQGVVDPAVDAGVLQVAPAADGTRVGDTPGAVALLKQRVAAWPGLPGAVHGFQYAEHLPPSPSSPRSPSRRSAPSLHTCPVAAGEAIVSGGVASVVCGLQPGASGGPFLVDGELVGVVATVTSDGTNRLALASALRLAADAPLRPA